ncbi:MAG: ABC transporter permease [Pseudomonadota bacterium]
MNKHAPRSVYHPLWELVWVRVLEFTRSPEAIFWSFGFPVLLAVALGIAFRDRPPEAVRVIVEAGPDGAPAIAELLRGQAGIEVQMQHADEAARRLRTGQAELVLALLGAAGPATKSGIVYRYDQARPESREARQTVDAALQRRLGRRDAVIAREEHVTERGARYIDFLIPGLIGLNIMGSGMWGIAWTVVDSRQRKLLKRFAATPMRRAHFLLSFVLSRLVFLAVEVALLLAFGVLVFGIPVRGSIGALALTVLCGTLSFSGLALLVAARPSNPEVASGWMNLVMMPMWILSGSFFSYSRFPEVLHPAIRALPLTALNDGLRAVLNEGAAVLSLWPELAVMLAWGLLSFVLALRLFRWQ